MRGFFALRLASISKETRMALHVGFTVTLSADKRFRRGLCVAFRQKSELSSQNRYCATGLERSAESLWQATNRLSLLHQSPIYSHAGSLIEDLIPSGTEIQKAKEMLWTLSAIFKLETIIRSSSAVSRYFTVLFPGNCKGRFFVCIHYY